MSRQTPDLTALVKELRPDRTTGEVIDEIQNRWRRRLTPRERRTTIEYCSRLTNWGHTQHVAAMPVPVPMPTSMMPEDTKRILDQHGRACRKRLHEVLLCIAEWVVSEELLKEACPPAVSV